MLDGMEVMKPPRFQVTVDFCKRGNAITNTVKRTVGWVLSGWFIRWWYKNQKKKEK